MIVIDASITVSWFFADELTEERRAILARVLIENATAPQHWPIETVNVLTMGFRRKRLTESGMARSVNEVLALPVTASMANPDQIRQTVSLAQRYRLTAYDAAYLELAVRLRLPLATFDNELVAAARAAGVEVLP